ncbi:putative alanine--tRNA ligase PWA37_005302, partial [Arxiozyma heterogenica]|uniref:putative alanine--tRNA ligase n=1 Tax=Arxiozyma heterogenica TaxID=278026 RepID=UPI002EF138F1
YKAGIKDLLGGETTTQDKAYLLKDDYGTIEFLLQVFKKLPIKPKTYKKPYHITLCFREKD